MCDLSFETILQILAALPYTELVVIARVCRDWQSLRSSDQFRAMRAAVDERGLVVVGGRDVAGGRVRTCSVLAGGRWRAVVSRFRRFFDDVPR